MLFQDECYEQVFNEWKDRLNSEGQGLYALARVPDFQSLIHMATNQQLPIFEMTKDLLKEEGLYGSSATVQ